MNSRDIARGHAWHGPYRRPTSERIRNCLCALALGLIVGLFIGAGI